MSLVAEAAKVRNERGELLGITLKQLDLARETQAVQKLRKLTLSLDQSMQAGQDASPTGSGVRSDPGGQTSTDSWQVSG